MPPTEINRTPSGSLGPRKAIPTPLGAVWITSNQVCDRYGGRSQMWLWRKVKNDPAFPRPTYFGRLMFFAVAALDSYDRACIEMQNSADRVSS